MPKFMYTNILINFLLILGTIYIVTSLLPTQLTKVIFTINIFALSVITTANATFLSKKKDSKKIAIEDPRTIYRKTIKNALKLGALIAAIIFIKLFVIENAS